MPDMTRALDDILLVLSNGRPGWLSMRILGQSFYMIRGNGHHAPEAARIIMKILHGGLERGAHAPDTIRVETGPSSRHETLAARGRLMENLRAAGHDPQPLLAGLDTASDRPAWAET